VSLTPLGRVAAEPRLVIKNAADKSHADLSITDLTQAWRGTLGW
jgi:hypothetical protein